MSKFRLFYLFDVIIVLCLLLLPYLLFDGRLFVGGDDTRLFYAYPKEFFNNLAFYSWNSISSLPIYLPNHQSLPFLAVWSLLDELVKSKIILSYLAFSLPFVIGFIYFQKFLKEIIGNEYRILLFSSMFFILSPIIVINQMSVFLTSVWLIPLFPIVGYYMLRFTKNGETKDVFKVVIWSVFLSIAYYAIPWLVGLIIPLAFALLIFYFFVDTEIRKYLKRFSLFLISISVSQLFWLIPFVASLTQRGESGLGERAVSSTIVNTFSPTVLSTATGNIIYPLFSFFHRSIISDFSWQADKVFSTYYDLIMPLSIVFVVVLVLGTVSSGILKSEQRKYFIYFLISFLAVLYLFTVNLGILKNLFLFLGLIPGFAMFRNFYDKFALPYIFIYATLISLCLLSIKQTNKKIFSLIIPVGIIVILLNFIPVRHLVNSPLWTTENVYRTVLLPAEYTDFLNDIKTNVDPNRNIFTYPQNIASYAIVTEDNKKNAYVGTSPLRYFTGVNDLTGGLSYPGHISGQIHKQILDRDYSHLVLLLEKINVGYILVVNNIPEEVKKSYLFDKNLMQFQDKELLSALIGKEIVKSRLGNYVLYEFKKSPSLFTIGGKQLDFEKINQTEYYFSASPKESNKLLFNETYNPGWKIYPISKNGSYLEKIMLLFIPSLFSESHRPNDIYGNDWKIDSSAVNNLEGSRMMLYFLPQSYFYLGVVLTVVLLFFVFVTIDKSKNENSK